MGKFNCNKIIILVLSVFYIENVDSVREKLVPYNIPELRAFKKTLGYYEDTYLNFTELTAKNGYWTEEHSVTTEDGYILTAFRILPKCQGSNKQRPVLLMHGILDSSDLWIVSGKDTGIGYMLANFCYDVWALNHRGNRYSRKHINYNPDTDKEYWNYSFDEHGNFDLPAIIDHILHVTNYTKLNYIGHSQGTTDFFVMSSLRPEYNEKIQVSIQLGPIAWMTNIPNPIFKLLSRATDVIKIFLDSSGYSEFLAQQQLLHLIIEILCQMSPEYFCTSILNVATGYLEGTISNKTLAIAFGHVLSGTSSKSLAHFGQLINSPYFQRYDEGRKGNLERYRTPTPPQYNISLITSPIVLISARNDWLSSLKDVETLASRLSNLLENYVVSVPYWSHHNHIFGTNASKYVFPKIIEYLNRFN